MASPVVPYCGSAPVPGSVTWNLDPILLACLLAIAYAHLRVLPPAQLGGLIMWVPAGLLLTGYALAAFGWELFRLARVDAERAELVMREASGRQSVST
jgi:hypothetical protein